MTHEPSTPIPGCEFGVTAEDLAAIGGGLLEPGTEAVLRTHVAGCGACAERLSALAWTAAAVAEYARGRAATRSAPSVRGGWNRAVAAVLVAALATGAVAAAWPRLAGLLGMRQRAGITLDEASRLMHLDLDAAGIPQETEFFRDVCDVRLDGSVSSVAAPGTLVAFRTVVAGTARTDLAAFDAKGALLWRTKPAGDALPSWGRLLADRTCGLDQVRVVTTTLDATSVVQSGVASLRHGPQSAVLLFDPVTGRERGIVWHDGILASDAEPTGSVTPAVLPPAPGTTTRNLVFVGSDPHPGGGTSPCVLVVTADGRVLQHVRLPRSGTLPQTGNSATGVRVGWTRPGDVSPGDVAVFTTEEMDWEFPVSGGRLDIAHVVAAPTDAFRDLFNRTSGSLRYDDVAGDDAKLRSFLTTLRAAVRDDPAGTEKELWPR